MKKRKMEKNDMWNHDEIMKEENVETGTVHITRILINMITVDQPIA